MRAARFTTSDAIHSGHARVLTPRRLELLRHLHRHPVPSIAELARTLKRDYKRGTTLKVEKGVGAKYLELRISDKATQLQPEFVVKVWE